MKTLRFALLATAFAGSALIVTAGPGPQFWIRPPAPKTDSTPAPKATVAAAAQPVAAACTTCSTGSCCKKG